MEDKTHLQSTKVTVKVNGVEQEFYGKIGYGVVKRRHRIERWIPKNLLLFWIEAGDSNVTYEVNFVLASSAFMRTMEKYFNVEFSNDEERGRSAHMDSSCQTESKLDWAERITQNMRMRIKRWKESHGNKL